MSEDLGKTSKSEAARPQQDSEEILAEEQKPLFEVLFIC